MAPADPNDGRHHDFLSACRISCSPALGADCRLIVLLNAAVHRRRGASSRGWRCGGLGCWWGSYHRNPSLRAVIDASRQRSAFLLLAARRPPVLLTAAAPSITFFGVGIIKFPLWLPNLEPQHHQQLSSSSHPPLSPNVTTNTSTITTALILPQTG